MAKNKDIYCPFCRAETENGEVCKKCLLRNEIAKLIPDEFMKKNVYIVSDKWMLPRIMFGKMDFVIIEIANFKKLKEYGMLKRVKIPKFLPFREKVYKFRPTTFPTVK